MCGCCLSPTEQTSPPNRLSVHLQGEFEADRHKWIESEKAGRDLGEVAIHAWVRQHWSGFLRQRWIDHIEGRAFWIELDHDDFDLLARTFTDSPLIAPILERLKCGWENLSLLNWAIDEKLPIEDVLHILEVFDINSRRLECRFGNRLSCAC